MRLVSELGRRNVLRMAVLYVVVAWLIVQVADVLIDLAKLPDWVGTTTLWLLAVGFPIALIFSWFYEITPEGISLEKDVDRTESITHITGRRLDFIVISLLCAAVILFAYDKWWIRGPPEQSIAVLPFVNISDDAGNEYFSDGISEELLNLLAKIPELRVISRSSAFSFKGKDISIPTVAAELNVAHVLEGSVRKNGNQVRITAQLIEARSDTHLWSETYDRELEDIFAIQDEVAAAVVEQLKVSLLGESPTVAETDPEAYSLYLQARYLSQQLNAQSLEQSIALYKQALDIDPDYAPAWTGLADTYTLQTNQGLRSATGITLAREAIEKALAINPNFAPAHSRLGSLAARNDNLAASALHLRRALSLDPVDSTTLGAAVALIVSLGRREEAIALNEFLVARDPVNPARHHNLGFSYLRAGRWDDAIKSLRTSLRLSTGHSFAHYGIGTALLMKGEAEAALEAMRQEPWEAVRLRGLVMAHYALGQTSESDALLEGIIKEVPTDPNYADWVYVSIAYVLAYRNETDRAFEWLAMAVEYEDAGLTEVAIEPLFTNIHNDTRWLPFLESIGKSPEQLAAIEFDVTLPE